MVKKLDTRISLLLDVFDQSFDKRAWHGTGLRGSLRGLTAPQALWRPQPGAHNIWELALHTAYWKYVTVRRLTGDTTLRFDRSGSNWPRLPTKPDAESWKKDVALLTGWHKQLREAIRMLPPARLQKRSPKGTWTYEQLIYGIASHDLYHAGQIQALKRLQKRRR